MQDGMFHIQSFDKMSHSIQLFYAGLKERCTAELLIMRPKKQNIAGQLFIRSKNIAWKLFIIIRNKILYENEGINFIFQMAACADTFLSFRKTIVKLSCNIKIQ
jgi:hypothetical protein